MTRTYSSEGLLSEPGRLDVGKPTERRARRRRRFTVVTRIKDAESLEDGKKVVRKVEVKEQRRSRSTRAASTCSSTSIPGRRDSSGTARTRSPSRASYTFAPTHGRPSTSRSGFRFPAAQACTTISSCPSTACRSTVTSEPARRPRMRRRRASPRPSRPCAERRGAIAGKPLVVEVRYRSQGLDTWRYDFGGEDQSPRCATSS